MEASIVRQRCTCSHLMRDTARRGLRARAWSAGQARAAPRASGRGRRKVLTRCRIGLPSFVKQAEGGSSGRPQKEET
jgi:hypothetical protein